jgi:hypothetical protein
MYLRSDRLILRETLSIGCNYDLKSIKYVACNIFRGDIVSSCSDQAVAVNRPAI